jgi:hypothetical protein
MIKQNGDFGDVDRLSSKVIQVVAQQFNEALVGSIHIPFVLG